MRLPCRRLRLGYAPSDDGVTVPSVWYWTILALGIWFVVSLLIVAAIVLLRVSFERRPARTEELPVPEHEPVQLSQTAAAGRRGKR